MVNCGSGFFFWVRVVFSHVLMENLRSILRSRYMIVEESGSYNSYVLQVADAQR